MKKNILLLAFMSLSVASYSQKDTTLNRTVIVENNYNPEVMDASKINVLPKVEELKVPKTDIRYITEVSPYTSYSNDAMPFQLVEPEARNSKNGYLRAGYGNYSNTDLFAKYTLGANTSNRLSFDAGLEGMKGKLEDWSGRDWNGRFFTSHLNADYAHYFKDYIFTVGGKLKSQVFNYINYDEPDKQHNTIVDVNASFGTQTDKLPLSFNFKVGYRSFSQKYAVEGVKVGSQKDFYVDGDVSGKLNDDSNVALAFKLDNISDSYDGLKGFTAFRANPSYNLQGDDWRIRIGAHADYQTAEEKGVKFAPDMLAQYIFSDSYLLYVKADGGVILNDFNRLSELSPYARMQVQYYSSYIPFDGKIGFKASPMNEMWFHLFAGYRKSKNELSYMVKEAPIYSSFYQTDFSCMYAGAEFRYGFKDMFDISAKAVYYNWTAKDEVKLALVSKPEITFDMEIKYKVVTNLYLNGGFSFIKRRDDLGEYINSIPFEYGTYKNLYLGAEYGLFRNISVYAKVNNILNSKNIRPDCYPSEKFNFIGGLVFRF